MKPLPLKRAPLPHWTLRQRFIHWRLRKARDELYRATLYRRKNPAHYIAVKGREHFWTNQWIKTFQKSA